MKEELRLLIRDRMMGQVVPESTRRDLEILQLVASGTSYKEISQYLKISEHTISSHLDVIRKRLVTKGEEYPTIRRAVVLAVLEGKIDIIPASPKTLTQREVETMDFALMGMSNEQIANELVVSTKTIEAHFENIKSKIGGKSNLNTIAMVASFVHKNHIPKTIIKNN